MQSSPVWILAVRGLQLALAIVVLGLSSWAVHDAYIGQEAFALAVAFFTMVILAYVLVTEKVATARRAHNPFAVLALDTVMVVMWLIALAVVAARRAKFVYTVTVSDCYDTGTLLNSKTCNFSKRSVVLFQSGLDMMSAIAALSSVVCVLFVATCTHSLLSFIRHRRTPGSGAVHIESK